MALADASMPLLLRGINGACQCDVVTRGSVGAEESFGHWQYVLVKKVSDIGAVLNAVPANIRSAPARTTATAGH